MNTLTTDTMAGAKSPKANRDAHLSKDGQWRSFPKVPGLLQYVSTGTYFARTKVKGKLFRQSLETDVFTTAKLKLPDKLKEFRKPKAALGTFAEARLLYEADLANDHTLAPESKQFRLARIAALLKTWPGLDKASLTKISVPGCKEWAKRFAAQFEAGNFNNTLGTLRAILERGGLGRDENPAYRIKRLGVKAKELQLPEPDQFDRILETVETAGARQSHDCADLIRFLASSGCRISEARQVLWQDVDWERGEIKVRNAKRSRTSNTHELRFVPIIPPMRELLERLQRERQPEPTARVCVLGECERSLTRACRLVGAPRITHHDLRHLFATRCIEAGVDIPTVSRWLGHVDGGALAMKVYGHLRRAHSAEMAAKVTFGQTKPENVLPLPQAQEASA
jgi:integrase